MSYRYFLLAQLLVLPLCSHATSFEEYKRQTSSEYQEYRDARDKEFVSFLKQQWTEFNGFKGVPLYKEPKPRNIPVAEAKPGKAISKEPAKIAATPLVAAPAPAVLADERTLPLPPVADQNKSIATFDFYGVSVNFAYAPQLRQSLAVLNQNGISEYWSELSKADYVPLMTQITNYQRSLKLNDWGTFILVDSLARSIEQGKENEVVLLSWFLMTKLGYDTKVGYNGKNAYLMVAVSHMVYQIGYFVEGQKKYYLLTNTGRLESAGKLYTYKGNYPDANTALSFKIIASPQFTDESRNRQLSFQFAGERHNIVARYSPHLIDYYRNFPQSEYSVYFDANVNDVPLTSLLAQLAPLLKGKSEEDAVNLLLRFVQTAFVYKTDEQQFSHEKVMLPEETLFYPYSDCEDRAILFAYLVRKLLGLQVVALHYPDHLATAVAFSSPVSGDAHVFKGKRFVVSDPTYINANVGMTMPQYKNSKVEIIEM